MNIESLPFVPGLQLCEVFFHEAVRPILDRHFPGLSYAAARLDYGSDVLGFDTPQSRDHGWGPKAMLFLLPDDFECYKDRISDVMALELPPEVRGYPTNFDKPFSGDGGMQAIAHGRVRHWVAVTTVGGFFEDYLSLDLTRPLSVADWLSLPQQHLGTIQSGKVFHDGLNDVSDVIACLRWYPQDIWVYLLANQWRRIDQEEPFMARCGDVGDELGSRIVATRQIVEIMKLCFLMERQYAPYYKWFGTAFNQLACAPRLRPIFQRVLESLVWTERENHLSEAYRVIMQMHNALGLTPVIEPEISYFFNRPYRVPQTARFVDALHQTIQSSTVRNLPRDLGGVDQFVDSTDILSTPQLCKKFKLIYSED